MLKILLLSNEVNIQFVDFLKKRGFVDWQKNPITKKVDAYDWIISYGYRHIIPEEIIKKTKNPIINLHISYLPFNRGSHPNYWSFKEKTPKGVTIHFIDKGIDTGPILCQKEFFFESYDTLHTSYLKLKKSIEQLFYDSFDKIISNEIIASPQTEIGTYHKEDDLPKDIDWNININEF